MTTTDFPNGPIKLSESEFSRVLTNDLDFDGGLLAAVLVADADSVLRGVAPRTLYDHQGGIVGR